MVNGLFIVFGVILLVGGFFGWKAGSTVSLIAGSVSAVLVFVGSYLVNQNPKVGYIWLTVVSVLLAVNFLMRFLKTGAFMPSGMLMVVSMIFVVIGILAIIGVLK